MVSIEKPNYTQTPNVLFDVAMKNLSDAELRVLLAVVRKTFGWGKTRDRISLTQIQSMTGLSRQGAIDGKTGLIKKGIINEFKTPSGNEYEVNVVDQQDGELVNTVDQKNGEVVNEVDQTSQRSRPKLVNVVDTQKKINKLSKEKDKNAADAAIEPVTKDQSLHHKLISYFDSGYKMVHHEKMDWSKKELGCVKNIITKAKSSGEDPEIILRRKLKMFQDNFQMPDDWYAKAPFTPSFFLCEWPKLNERRTPITKSDRARMENDMSVEEMIRDSVEKAEKKKLERAGTR